MKADIDGAVRIARIAGEFGWTWTEPDVARFCAATGWSVLHGDRGYGPNLRTDLDVHLAQCRVSFSARIMDRQEGGGGIIDRFAVYVADSERTESEKARFIAAHRELRDRLIEELGPTSEYVFGEDLEADYWRRTDVVVSVSVHDSFIQLDFVNPRYQRWLDEEGAYDFSYGDDDGDAGPVREVLRRIGRMFRRSSRVR
ncbi:DUF6301 family protein [Nocardia sp. NPDC058058]|uniref:DUF6301 family protein n=1 Tax=Nocardia sp. NPDC058058 TaxID=3346317 RepID=UPI0036DA11FA